MLSARLRELEDGDVIERTLQPRPFSGVVYGLTPYGKALEKSLLTLGLWGAQSLGEPPEGFCASLSSLSFPLRAMFQEHTMGEHLFRLCSGGDCLNVMVKDNHVCFPAEAPAEPEVVLEIAPDVLLAIMKRFETFESAVDSGRLKVHGSVSKAREFFDIFKMPGPIEAPVS